MKKHTCGPWIAEMEEASDHRGIAICAPANGWIVATITPEEDRQADEIDWANARLITAAPDLLTACERALQQLDLIGGLPATIRLLNEAKAKGRD